MPYTSSTTGQTGTQTGTQFTRTATPAETAEENLSAIPGLANLSTLINEINRSAQQAANVARVPGGQALEEASSANIQSALGGQLPSDVVALLAQKAAQVGVGSGMGVGAPITNAELLRAMGLTSLDLQGTGQNWLTAALARNPAAPLYPVQTGLITPAQAGTTVRSDVTTTGSTGTSGVSPDVAGYGGGAQRAGARDTSWINDLFGGGGAGMVVGGPLGAAPSTYVEQDPYWGDAWNYVNQTGGVAEDPYWSEAWNYVNEPGGVSEFDYPSGTWSGAEPSGGFEDWASYYLGD